MSNCWVVLAAAGTGTRMAATLPKQYLPLAGRTVIEHSLNKLLAFPVVQGAVVVLANADGYWDKLDYRTSKPLWRATGGIERYQSVLNGLQVLRQFASVDDWVLVHDAARPCVRRDDLERLLITLANDPVGGLLAVPVRDTMKRGDADGRISRTEQRSGLWHAQTPQMFRLGLLYDGLTCALREGISVTDEAAALEALGLAPRLVSGHHDNIKITTPEDLALAEFYLTQTI